MTAVTQGGDTPPPGGHRDEMDVLVIGAGQAGLAAGWHLRRTGLRFAIVERAAQPGESWRRRYRSLTLFTPRALSALPGLPLHDHAGADPWGYPAAREFADYLVRYAREFDLPVRCGDGVARLERLADGRFLARLDSGTALVARAAIVAAGPFQRVRPPAWAAALDPALPQLSADRYAGPEDLPTGPVLVAGDGATGRDIAAELAASRPVLLATGRPRRLLPERVLGRSTWFWLQRTGLLRAGPDSLVGRRMQRLDPFPDRQRSLKALAAMGVGIRPRLAGGAGRQLRFADGSTAEVAALVWATGMAEALDWLAVPGALDGQGRVLHRGGVSPVPGLYHLGRPWQRNRASALVMGAGPDAGVIVARLLRDLGRAA